MNGDQRDAMDRVRFFKEEVGMCIFHPEPCPLLMMQLNEARVLVKRLADALLKAEQLLAKDST